MKVKAKVRRIGKSLGIITPSAQAARGGVSEGDSVEIDIERRANLGELFGSAKFSKPAQCVKDETREGWGEYGRLLLGQRLEESDDGGRPHQR